MSKLPSAMEGPKFRVAALVPEPLVEPARVGALFVMLAVKGAVPLRTMLPEADGWELL